MALLQEKRADELARTIHVGGLMPGITEENLVEFFSRVSSPGITRLRTRCLSSGLSFPAFASVGGPRDRLI